MKKRGWAPVVPSISIAMSALWSTSALAQAQIPTQRGEAVTVTATRTEADPFDVPASIDRVDGADVRNGRLQVNLSESLGVVPGLALSNRQNYAQDLQLSIRGFGARSTFGIRGIRLYVDGIPARSPTARASSPTSTSDRSIASKSCGVPSRRSTATRRAA